MADRDEPSRTPGASAPEPGNQGSWLRDLGAALLVTAVVAGVFIWSAQRNYEQQMARLSVPAFAVVVVAAIFVTRKGALRLLERLLAPIRTAPRAYLFGLSGVLLVALLLIARLALLAFPNSGDEYAYLLQAETFVRGKLWVPAPDPPEAFQLLQFVQKDGRWLSIYQPGWSALLAVPLAVGLPAWLVNPILGACAVWAFYRLCSRCVRPEAAILATLAAVTSAFFLLNFASFMSHGAGALAAVLFALCGLRYLQEGGPRWAILAGLCLGGLGFIRAINAILLAAPFVLALLMRPRRRMGLAWLALGGLPFALALLAYNKAITGDALLVVQAWVARGREPLGGPTSRSMSESLQRLVRLYLWTSPVLVVGWPLAFLALARRKALTFVDWLAPMTVVGFAFYGGSGGFQYGPRYYFEGIWFALVTMAKAAEPMFSGKVRRADWLAAAAVTHLAFQVGYAVPRIAREHEYVVERQDLFIQVAKSGLTNAVVMIADSPSDLHRVLRILPSRDLLRNGLEVGDEDVTYALDRGDATTRKLMARFPGRHFYRYYRGRLEDALTPDGTLRPKPNDAY